MKAHREVNYRHSSLRSVVGQAFGVWKRRFPILKVIPPYSLRNQGLFVVAYYTIHNFIRKSYEVNDPLFKQVLHRINPWIDVSKQEAGPIVSYIKPEQQPGQLEDNTKFMKKKVQDAMATHMWDTDNGM